jgi:hypothetical protein
MNKRGASKNIGGNNRKNLIGSMTSSKKLKEKAQRSPEAGEEEEGVEEAEGGRVGMNKK